MSKLAILINELERKIPEQELVNQAISQASVGWHIEHTLLTINLIIETLVKSDPANYRWKFSFIKTLVYATNKIPRGRAQSPKPVRPKEGFTTETLTIHTGITKEKIKVLESLQPDNFFKHPYFGDLNLKPAIKFIELHTQHHLHIINDIVKDKQPD